VSVTYHGVVMDCWIHMLAELVTVFFLSWENTGGNQKIRFPEILEIPVEIPAKIFERTNEFVNFIKIFKYEPLIQM
jgi:hypothetical protein